jgi:alkanesulfonate monooxygenase SsuD/methylene tetrahydromethanopterin reductase-like flavin-dependent oxidoreductase (luciferase family)
VIEIPANTRVYGMQLPVQAQSEMFVAEWERTAGPKELAKIANAADDYGFHYVGVCDHIALTENYAERMGTHWSDCIGTMSWLAALTRRVNLLSHAYVLPYRHPLIAAKQFATLDHLSGGRAIVGIGGGHVEPEFEKLGVDYHRRGKLVDERLPVLAAALEHEYVDGYGAKPRPVQQPRPPIWIAGSSPAAIRRAARYEGWLPQGPADADMIGSLWREREANGTADRPFAIGHVVLGFVYVGVPDWDAGEGTVSGSPEQVAEQILAGTPDGVNQLQVRFRARSCEELCDQIAAFGTSVAPLVTKL